MVTTAMVVSEGMAPLKASAANTPMTTKVTMVLTLISAARFFQKSFILSPFIRWQGTLAAPRIFS